MEQNKSPKVIENKFSLIVLQALKAAVSKLNLQEQDNSKYNSEQKDKKYDT